MSSNSLILPSGGLKTEIVQAYAAQLVYVLDHFQRLEIMHRDLKPMNILLDDDYNLKVVSNCMIHLIQNKL